MAVPHGLLVADHSAQVLQRVHKGEIGQLKLVEIQCTGWDIINAGIHWLNFFVELTEREPVEYVIGACDASTRTWRDSMQVETLAVTYAQTASGTRVVMNTGDYVTFSEPVANTLFRLVGTLGTIDFYGWETRYRILKRRTSARPAVRIRSRTNHPSPAPPRKISPRRSIGRNRTTPSPKDRWPPSKLCEAAYVSIRNGSVPVPLPLDDFTPPPAVDWQPGLPYSGQGGGRNGRRLPPRPEQENSASRTQRLEES